MNPTSIGTITECAVLAALIKAGKTVLMPFGGGQRYDLVVDDDSRFLRIQCKTGRLKSGLISFNACSVSRDGKSLTYEGQADVFGVYCPDNGSVYLVPVDRIAPRLRGRIRISANLYGSKKNLLNAEEFLLGD